MPPNKKDIITLLKKEILPLEGLRPFYAYCEQGLGLGLLNEAFPLGSFPLGAVHEFISEGYESAAAMTGFISAMLGGLMKNGGAAVWIANSEKVFPPALKIFGVEPERVLFVDLHKEKDLLWSVEEALKCNGLSVVIGEVSDLSFTTTRRFQLAVEQSQVTGFILRSNPHNLNANACVSRWRIKPLPSESYENLPGLSFPRWNVELLKIRNGKPGAWQLEWKEGCLRHITKTIPSIIHEPRRKTG